MFLVKINNFVNFEIVNSIIVHIIYFIKNN